MMVTGLIADDEPLARRKIRSLAADVGWFRIVGEAGDGPATVAALDRLEPDLVLLDLKMPGFDGFEVLRRAAHKPAVIFTTAYDRFAVAAFAVHAIDYLLKPFDQPRFLAALERARGALGQPDPQDQVRELQWSVTHGIARRLFIRHAGRIVVVPLDRIESFEARRDYVAVVAPPNRYLVQVTMGEVAAMLPPDRFVRIHRSVIVNLDFAAELAPHGNGQLAVQMQSGRRLIASRSRSRDLRGLAL